MYVFIIRVEVISNRMNMSQLNLIKDDQRQFYDWKVYIYLHELSFFFFPINLFTYLYHEITIFNIEFSVRTSDTSFNNAQIILFHNNK